MTRQSSIKTRQNNARTIETHCIDRNLESRKRQRIRNYSRTIDNDKLYFFWSVSMHISSIFSIFDQPVFRSIRSHNYNCTQHPAFPPRRANRNTKKTLPSIYTNGGQRFSSIHSFITSFVENIQKVYREKKWSEHVAQMM